jgi:pyruvate/2-oxoglutarate dehydrogenase complex dihydrolipoamide dehydrogenase (E3) component
MKTLIIGAGSIGIRHGSVLTAMGHSVKYISKHLTGKQIVGSNINLAVTQFRPEYVVISNETVHHVQAVEELVSCGYNKLVFVEKPAQLDFVDSTTLGFESIGVGYNSTERM